MCLPTKEKSLIIGIFFIVIIMHIHRGELVWKT